MTIEHSIKTALDLKRLLQDEVEKTQEGILKIRQLDLEAINQRGKAREEFNLESAILEEQLMKDMENAGQAIQLESTSLSTLIKGYPAQGPQLAQTVNDIQGLASEIKQLDAFQQTLIQKTLTFVRSYMDCLAPKGFVYNKKGLLKEQRIQAKAKIVNVSHHV
jgi:hypothetical protein